MHEVWKHEGWSSLPAASHLQSSRPGGPRRLSEVGVREGGRDETERGTYWRKLILKGWYLLWGAKKDVNVRTVNTDLVSMGVGFGIRNGLGYWQWPWKGLCQPSRPTAPLYRRDQRAAADVLCRTNHLYDQCLVESTAQTKLVRYTELKI